MTTTPAFITREDLHSLTTAITGLTEVLARLTPATPPTGLRIPEGPAQPLLATAAGLDLPPVSPAFKPVGDAYQDLPKCHGCERPLRPLKAQAIHWPGTISRVSSTECTTCYARRYNGSKPRTKAVITQTETTVPMDQLPTCTDCGKTMRPQGATADRYPGTVAYSGTQCGGCYKRASRAIQAKERNAKQSKDRAERAEKLRLKAKAEAEATTSTREQRLVRELDGFLAARRKRGAPAEGIQFEGEEAKCRSKSATASR